MTGLVYSFILLPVINSILVFLIPNRRKELFRPLTVYLSLIPLGLCLYMFVNQNLKTSFLEVDSIPWITAYGIDLIIGFSGMSFLLITLNCLLVLLSILSVNQEYAESKGFLGSIMLLQAAVNGVARSFLKSSQQISYSQTGLVRNYVVYFGLFMLALILVFLFSPGVLL